MAKFSITQLEQATVVPAGSLHLVEMGDGSGTKAVTQEVLEEKIGEALKIGDLAQLQTENKESIVAAINEAAQSGGGGATVDILDSKEEIEANTETGKAAGALAVQEMFTELNDNVGFKTRINPDDPTKIQWKSKTGDGDWQNFKGALSGVKVGTLSAENTSIDIKSLVANYENLTTDNIFVKNQTFRYGGFNHGWDSSAALTLTPTISYNPATGIISGSDFTGTVPTYGGSGKVTLTVSADIYVVS